MAIKKYITSLFNLTTAGIAIILLLASGSLLTSCRDDLNRATGLSADGTGLVIRIPDISSAAEFGKTRSNDKRNTRAYDQSKEGAISNLYVVAVPQSEGQLLRVIRLDISNQLPTDGYNSYPIELYPGNYKIYVVANLDQYLPGATTTNIQDYVTTENDIKGLILNSQTDSPLMPGHLPMACLPEEVNGASNGYVAVNQGSATTITADLTFLCSKVRYTILFDNTQPSADNPEGGISKAFKNRSIRFFVDQETKPVATNLRKQTQLHKTPVLSDYDDGFLEKREYGHGGVDGVTGASYIVTLGYWTLDLDRYYYPMDNMGRPNNNYPLRPSDQLTLWDGTLDEWKQQPRRAWQGVVYLPENEATLNDKKTILYFPYYNVDREGYDSEGGELKKVILFGNDNESGHTTAGNQDSNYGGSADGGNNNHGISRGKMYDVVALVRTPDPVDLETVISVSDWSLEELSYQIYGPVELIVDKTVIDLAEEDDPTINISSNRAINFISPEITVNNDPVAFYSFIGVGEGVWRVRINPLVTDETLSNLKGDNETDDPNERKSSYSYFDIVAGNIIKRIKVKNITSNI